MFEEFLELHNPEESKKLRQIKEKEENEAESEDEEEEEDSTSETDEESQDQDKLADQKISDLEYMKKLVKKPEKPKKEPKNIELFTVKVGYGPIRGLQLICVFFC